MILVFKFLRGFFEMSVEVPLPVTKVDLLAALCKDNVPDDARVFLRRVK
jgi:hypothetical protein